ncbi:MAG TPA: NAD-binding protein [Prolixibacteraceae bacterium]|nr:NAD-binding protein [Prolixibacteraceae bacterium]
MKKRYALLLKNEFFIIFSLTIITIILGYFSYRYENQPVLESLYKTLQFFKLKADELNHLNIGFEIARWSSAIILVYATFKFVLLIVKDKIDEVIIRLNDDHIVICGLSSKAKDLIEEIRQAEKKIVIIEKNKNHEALSAYKYNKNVKILIGDAEDEQVLKRANIVDASYIFSFTENDQTNLRITESIEKIFTNPVARKTLQNRTEPLRIRIHLKDYDNLMVFKEFHHVANGKIDYHAFNLFQQAAEKVIDEFSPDKFLSIKSEKDDQVHILVSGLTLQGEYLIIEAAQMYHFANLKPLKITIVDHDVKNKLKLFLNRFPNLEDVLDIHSVETYDFVKMKNMGAKIGDVSVCFICHKDDAESVNKYRLYRQLFYKINKTLDHPRIIAIMPQNNSLKTLFPGIESNAKDLNVTIKELYADFCKKSIIVDNKEEYDKVAVCVDYVFIREQKKIKKYLEEYNQADWDKKTDFEKDWNRYPARHLEIKLRAAGINLSDHPVDNQKNIELNEVNRNLLNRMEHNRWCAEKLLTGFISGEEPGNKEVAMMLKRKLKYHSELVEWKNLSIENQVKDAYTIDNLIYAARCQLNIK